MNKYKCIMCHLYVPYWLCRMSPDLCILWGSRSHPVSAVWKGSGSGSQHYDVWGYWGFGLPTQNLPPEQPVYLPSMSPALPVLRRAGTLWLPDLRPAQLPPQYEMIWIFFFCILLLLKKEIMKLIVRFVIINTDLKCSSVVSWLLNPSLGSKAL